MKKIKRTCRCGEVYETSDIYPLPVCPKCATAWDADIEARERTAAGLSYRGDADSAEAMYERRGIRPIHFSSTLENFVASTDEQRRAVSLCRKMITGKNGILVLIGGVGTGKTHLESAIVKEMGGRIMKMIEVGIYIRKAFRDPRPYDEDEALLNLSRLPLLAIDEIEKSKNTANEMAWLSYIIDERYSRALPTIIVANLHLSTAHGDGHRCDRCFETVMPDDILDRIRQVGQVQYFSGKSYRPSLRGEA